MPDQKKGVLQEGDCSCECNNISTPLLLLVSSFIRPIIVAHRTVSFSALHSDQLNISTYTALLDVSVIHRQIIAFLIDNKLWSSLPYASAPSLTADQANAKNCAFGVATK